MTRRGETCKHYLEAEKCIKIKQFVGLTCITLQIERVLGLRVWELKKTKQYIMIKFVNLKWMFVSHSST